MGLHHFDEIITVSNYFSVSVSLKLTELDGGHTSPKLHCLRSIHL